MTFTTLIVAAINLIAISILAFGIYFTRHRRRDLVAAFLGINIGVFAVASILSSVSVAMGVGLGLFGVLSIIRLRSSEINQREVAYYFSALAIGLIAGLTAALEVGPALPITLIALIVAVMYVADHPRLLSRNQHQIIRLDRAIGQEESLKLEISTRLAATVTGVTVLELDYINDSTLVDVRYRTPKNRHTQIPTSERNVNAQPLLMPDQSAQQTNSFNADQLHTGIAAHTDNNNLVSSR